MKKILIVYAVIGLYALVITVAVGLDTGLIFLPLFWLMTLPVCLGLLVYGIVYSVKNWRRYRWKALLPAMIAAAVVVSWFFVPSSINEYLQKGALAARASAVEWVLRQAPEKGERKVELPEEYEGLSVGGTVQVVALEDGASVFFEQSRGATMDSEWFIYTTDPAGLEAAYDLRHMEGNWYRGVKRLRGR